MPVEGEGSNEKNPQQKQQQQQQQQNHLVSQDLNFSLNDILSNNHHDVNDSSFQSIVQTLSNNNNDQHITPSYAHLPAELQDLLSNETDDLLSTPGSNSDASSLLHGDMTHLWNQQTQQQNFMSSPQSTKPSPASNTTSNISTPKMSTSTPQHQTPPPPQLPQQQQQQQPQPQPQPQAQPQAQPQGIILFTTTNDSS